MGCLGRALGLLAALALLSCAAPGTVHVVKPGETVYRIARYYRVPVKDVLLANRVADLSAISVGRKLHVPGTTRREPAYALPGPGVSSPAPAERRAQVRRAGRLRFLWPVRGRLSSRFGRRWGRAHQGIDVATRSGTPVRAAESGRVIYASRLGAYGKVVILRHEDGYQTVYAHNRKNRVRKGSRVARGQVIAELGATGNATGPHLHFEIRENDRARDPLLYLPR